LAEPPRARFECLRLWMFGDQRAFIAWTVRQHNRNSRVAAWERLALSALLSATSALTRLVGRGLQATLAQHHEWQAQLDAFNDYAFGDISDEEL
jgi:hypothetical protein